MKRIIFVLIVAVGLAVLYLLAWPVPIEPVAWNTPTAPAPEGVYAPNDYLASAKTSVEFPGVPAEAAPGPDGVMHTVFMDGRVARWKPDSNDYEIYADLKVSASGLAFDLAGNLYTVGERDSILFRVSPDGEMTVLVDELDGVKSPFLNDVAVATNGMVYFTESSQKYSFLEVTAEVFEHDPTGRLWAYDPTDQSTRVLLEGLHLANGVAISEDQSFLVIAEATAYQVRRYWLSGSKAGTDEILLDNLPGFPGNINAGSNGMFWMPLLTPRDPALDFLGSHPILRKVVFRLPSFLQPAAKVYSAVIGFDEGGVVKHFLQNSSNKVLLASFNDVSEANGNLYLAPDLAVVPGMLKNGKRSIYYVPVPTPNASL